VGMLSGLMTKMHRPIYEARLRELVRRIMPHLRAGDRVLDVGCGNGTLGRALMDEPDAPKGLIVEGLERAPRGGEPITVHAYDGVAMPFEGQSYDAVIVADVLHHERDPMRLLRECARVSRRLVIIKDHQVKGLLAQQRISLMDWAANAPYGVPCLYTYNTPDEWKLIPIELRLGVVEEIPTMNLYPAGWNLIFGKSLQYMAILTKQIASVPGMDGSKPVSGAMGDDASAEDVEWSVRPS
jgi:SAM-dependent methyltransferase